MSYGLNPSFRCGTDTQVTRSSLHTQLGRIGLGPNIWLSVLLFQWKRRCGFCPCVPGTVVLQLHLDHLLDTFSLLACPYESIELQWEMWPASDRPNPCAVTMEMQPLSHQCYLVLFGLTLACLAWEKVETICPCGQRPPHHHIQFWISGWASIRDWCTS